MQNKKQKQLPERMISLVDVLFGVGLGINFESLMVRPWFSDPKEITAYFFEILVVVLIYCWALGSWWSYHVSVRLKPIKSKRFFLDIVTMFIYFLIFVSYQNIKAEIVLFAISFAIYIIWDMFKERESGVHYGSKRDCATILWAFFFGLLLWSTVLSPKIKWLDWFFLLLTYVGTIGYRIHKWYLTISEEKNIKENWMVALRRFYGRFKTNKYITRRK